MKPSDDLHRLITSLSNNERRHFTLMSKLYRGDKHYLDLFEALRSQEQYNEEELKTKFAEQRFVKQFHVAKNYLNKLIMKSLRVFHSERSVQSSLYGLLHSVEILYDKSLFRQCRETLRKARAIAESYQRDPELLRIAVWEQRLDALNWFTATDTRTLDEQNERMLGVIRNVTLNWQYRMLLARAGRLFATLGAGRTPEAKAAMEAIINDPLMRDPENAPPLETRSMFYRIYELYHSYSGDNDQAYEYALRNVQLVKEYDRIAREYPSALIANLSNYLARCVRARRYDEFESALKDLHSLPAASDYDQKRIVWNSRNLELWYFIHSGQFAEALERIPVIRDDIAALAHIRLDALIPIFYFQCAYVYFATGRYRNALDACNEYFHSVGQDLRHDLQGAARLLFLAAHFEAGNIDALERLATTTRRFFIQYEALTAFESTALTFFRKLASATTPYTHKDLYVEFRSELDRILQDPNHRRALDVFDLRSWLEARIESISFTEAVRRRYHSE